MNTHDTTAPTTTDMQCGYRIQDGRVRLTATNCNIHYIGGRRPRNWRHWVPGPVTMYSTKAKALIVLANGATE